MANGEGCRIIMLIAAAPSAQIPVEEALRIFNQSQIFLCLGAAIVTVGLLAAAFYVLRRQWKDPALLWFSIFAVLYGVRLCIHHQPMWQLGERRPLLNWITIAIGYLVPVPAFLFFRTLKLLNPIGRMLMAIVSPVLVLLSLLALYIGPSHLLASINNAVVTVSLAIFAAELVFNRTASKDTRLIHRGLTVFLLSALYENLADYVHLPYFNIEPFAFVVLLISLGVVAGRRTLSREQQLTVIEKELQIAQRIQRAILPHAFPPSPHFRVAACYQPMRVVAGDFYDYLQPTSTEAGLLIADVSGHGVPAALIASMVKVVAASLSPMAGDPAKVLHRMNAELQGNVENQFVTAAYAYLNADTGELRYGAAAHPPLLLLRDGTVQAIEENGLLLGAFDFAQYTSRTIPLRTGDRIVLYTDGLLEGTNAAGEEFGPERLAATLLGSRGLEPSECAERAVEAVQQWSASQTDDLTVLVCDYIAEAAA